MDRLQRFRIGGEWPDPASTSTMPVPVFITFEDDADAIGNANDAPHGLSARVQTGIPDRAMCVSSRLRAGTVHVIGDAFNHGSPLGGRKRFGISREGGVLGLEDRLKTRTLHGLSQGGRQCG